MLKLKVLAIVVSLLVLPQVSASAVPELFWSYTAGGTVTGVAISDGGNYTAAASSDGYLYFLNKSKKLMWRVQTEDTPLKVAISSDGSRVYVGDGSNVYLYNKTGDEQWGFLVGDEIVDLVVTPSGDRIAVGSLNRHVYLLNDEGGILWKYRTNAPVISVAISSDGKYIAAGTSGSITYMLNRDGNLLWEHISRRSIDGVGILGGRVVSGERYLTFLEDGNRVGSYSGVVCDITGIETTANGEHALVGCEDGEVYFLDSSKKKQWSYDAKKTSRDSSISPKGDYAAVAGGNTVYILKSPDIAPPIVEITNPEEGESVSGIIKIDASVVEDSSYILRVLIDGDFACSKLPCSWNTGASAEGKHEITIEVEDSGENVGADSVNVTIKHTLLGDIAGEISEKQEIVEEKQVEIKEKLNENLPTNLPPIRKDRDYSPLVKGVVLILSVYVALKVLRPKRQKKGRRGKYKFRR
jgi:WD40 repeat protein